MIVLSFGMSAVMFYVKFSDCDVSFFYYFELESIIKTFVIES